MSNVFKRGAAISPYFRERPSPSASVRWLLPSPVYARPPLHG